jgi:hypothetical protein
MFEVILASVIVGKTQVGPELVRYDLLTKGNQIVVVLEDTVHRIFEVQ